MTEVAQCGSCRAPILWARMDKTGRLNPLDETEVPPAVLAVAFNPDTGGGHTLTANDMEDNVAVSWAEHGITFHLSHFATCPDSGRHRKSTRRSA